jgi:VCBS repeat-containing protein
MGTTDAYWLTINGKSTLHNKFVDCSDLVVTGADYCKMGVQLPQVLKDANATVRIYGISQTFTGGETVVLPMGQVITWYLKINGKEVAHTGKPVDCTPVNVTAADYCNVLNNSGASIDISGYGSVAAGNSVLFPTGIQIEWKPSTQHAWPGTKKAVDCTPLVSAPPVNQPPQAVDDTYNTSEDTALVIAPPGVLGNDNDPDGNPITAVKVSDPAHGALTINSDGSFTYTPAGNYNGPDSFTYKANDGTDDSNVATVTITVNMANDPPVANAGPDQADIEQTSYADAEVTLDGSGSSDPDGDTLTYEWTWASGTASGVNPTATFPLGSTTVTLTVSDGELSATDTVDIAVVDTTPPVVDITSPDDDKTYLNTEGPIPVEYTATDICDSSLTITMTLDGNLFTGDKINLCGMASGEHTLVVSAADDSGNTGTDSATFNVVPQSLKTFTIKHMLIQWSRPGIWARFDKDTFTLSGRLQLPAGCTVEDLNKSATLTIAISDASGTDTVLCKVRPLNKAGIIWKYNGKEQPPGEGMNIHNLIIWWTPQSGKWAGWAGFHISGVLQLPEEIGVNTQPAEATITIEMPAKTESGCGSLIAKNTVKFKVLGSARLWLYNVWPNLSAFPCEPTGTE